MSTAIEIAIGALATNVGYCLCERLQDSAREGGAPMPCICTVLPGAVVPYDYCEAGGSAWSRVVGIVPITSDIGDYTCATEYEVTIEVGILRCAPMLGANNELPSDAEQTAAAMQQYADMGLMHAALTCCTVPSRFDGPAVGSYVPLGPDGGCVGGSWTARWRFS